MIKVKVKDVEKLPVPLLEPTKPVRIDIKPQKYYISEAESAKQVKLAPQKAEKMKQEREKKKDPRWTQEEDDKIIKLFTNGVAFADWPSFPGRTNTAIQKRCRRLREKGVLQEKTSYMVNAWTEDDDKQLIEMYNNGCPYETISERLDRKKDAIGRRVSRLKQKGVLKQRDNNMFNRRWTLEEDHKIVDMHNSGMTNRQIADEMKRTEGVIKVRLQQLKAI